MHFLYLARLTMHIDDKMNLMHNVTNFIAIDCVY